MEERLDKLLVERKLVDSRIEAEKIIREDGVHVNGKLITKTGKKFPVDCSIELITKDIEWISKDAVKLLTALDHWNLSIENQQILDIGSGKGGFVQVALKKGAKSIVAVDKNSSEIEKNDSIKVLDNTAVRELAAIQFKQLFDTCFIDVSTTSLADVFPFINTHIKESGIVLAVFKPQYEVDRKALNKNGLLRDKKQGPIVQKEVIKAAEINQLKFIDAIPSPILGEHGNDEQLFLFKKV